jgi:large subunit ribosomal protein L9
MKVILLQEVQGLGAAGEVKSVANGYARNFLLPQQLVTPATPSALANLQEHVAIEKRRQEKLRAELESLTARLNQVTLRFAVKVGAQKRLYGSVTNQNIAAALQEQENITVDRRAIILPDALRALGSYKVAIHLGQGFEPTITRRAHCYAPFLRP